MKKYIENFFGEETGIETLEMIAFIALGAALLSVILVLYLRFKKSADNVKQATDSVMTQIEQYTKLEKRWDAEQYCSGYHKSKISKGDEKNEKIS